MSDETGFVSLENWQLVGAEYRNAVEKHGPRFGSVGEGLKALLSEVSEVIEALERNDVEGPHGVRREVAQVGAVAMKILEGLCNE